MAIEAPLSRYKKNNLLIFAAVIIGFAVWFAYDGYINKKFIEEHTEADGGPDGTLVLNKRVPFFLAGGAVLLVGYFFMIKDRKIVADENELKTDSVTIAYNSIESVNKTHFTSKGFFIITYKDSNGQEQQLKLSDRTYDNLGILLDHIVAKIT